MRTLLAVLALFPVTLAAQVDVNVRVERTEQDSSRNRRAARRIPVTAAHLATAFRDSRARDLLIGARRRRLEQDSALRAYDATSYLRMSVGLSFKAVGRERLMFRHENAARVRWEYGRGAFVELKGSRSVAPAIGSTDVQRELDRSAGEMGSDMTWIPYFPGQEGIWVGADLAEAEVNDRDLVHPLAEGAEAYYRYTSGDSMTYRLSQSRTVRLAELRIQPREPRWNLIVGSFWFDVETNQLVRAAYRLAVPIDLWQTIEDEGEDEDIPPMVRAIINPMRGNVTAITVEYGLYEGRFWLPRLQAVEAEGQAGFIRVPFRLEQRFDYASVNGAADTIPTVAATANARADTLFALDSLARLGDSTAAAAAKSIRDRETEARLARRDTLRTLDSLARRGDADARERARLMRQRPQCRSGDSYNASERRYDGTLRVTVEIPCNDSILRTSAALPASIYESTDVMFGGQDLAELRSLIDLDLQPEWSPQPPTIRYGIGDGMLRYNRVEGLSPAVRAEARLGAGYTADGEFRIGFADLEPNGELGVSRSDGRRTIRLGGFRRLAVANDWGTPLSFSASLSSLLFARDEGFYYRSWGAEATAIGTGNPHFSWRAFAERHDLAAVETDFSLAHALNGVDFLPNIAAEEGGVVGAAARIVHTLGEDPRGFRLLTELRGESGVGDFTYTRGLADFTLSRSLLRNLHGSLTLSAGGATSGAPLQRWFHLGGSPTIRGQNPGAMSGRAFWMTRAELGSSLVAFRPTLFGDIGWAGAPDDWRHPGRPASGVGVGASIFDGLIRFDIARGLYPRAGFRTDLYFEARF